MTQQLMMLVTLQQASDHLRRDTSADDADLTLKIQAASQAVIDYMKNGATFIDSSGDAEYDSAGEALGVPKNVQIAVLLMTGILYKAREGENTVDDWYEFGLPKAVQNILYGRRTPTMA